LDFTAKELADAGFQGFSTIAELRCNECCHVPEESGIYVVIMPETTAVSFLEVSPGGHFKRRDPTVDRHELEQRRIPDAPVVYIGRASKTKKTNLRRRLREFLAFGQGRPVGHWGGRLTWQIAGHDKLLVAWRQCCDFRKAEADLLDDFESRFERLPFANLRREHGD